MDKVYSCIEKLNLDKPKNEKFFTKKENLIEKQILRLPKHIDDLIIEIKKNGDENIAKIQFLYNVVSLEKFCEDKYVIAIILLMIWIESKNNRNDGGEPKFHTLTDDDTINYDGYRDCYDLVIKKVVYEIFKDNSGNNNVLISDMRIKEVKFDSVYNNIFGNCDKSVIKNKYQHKSQLKKKFLRGQETYDNGKIDYQLVMFNRIFELEMRNSPI